MKKMRPWLLYLLPIFCQAQTPSKAGETNLNALFDDDIKKDDTYKIVTSATFPKSEFAARRSTKTLTYSKDLKLENNNLKAILDDTAYSETEKIAFIQDVLADTSRDVFEYVCYKSIGFWRSSPKATELIEGYFKSKAFEKSDDTFIKYKHFEFRTRNLYPDAYDSIVDYFKKTLGLTRKKRYVHEADLLYRLIKLGKEREALQYLELLIKEYLNGQADVIHFDLQDAPSFEKNVFDLLCFSNDQEIAKKATDLLFEVLGSKDPHSDLIALSAWLDRTKHIKLLEKWFAHYETVNFSPADLKEEHEMLYYINVVPEGSDCFRFMDRNVLLGEVKGREMWKKFVKIMPYRELYADDVYPLRILEIAFRDASLTVPEMRTMLFQCPRGEKFYEDKDYYGLYKGRFLQLLCKAYPNRKVPKTDFDKLQLNKILNYTTPLRITEKDLEVKPADIFLTREGINTMLHVLNSLAKSTRLTGIELTEKERFYLSLQPVEGCIFNFFRKNNRLIAFDAESAAIPVNYVNFFETEFHPVLHKAGINDIEISQTVTKIKNDEYHYKVYMRCGEITYLYECTEHKTDWYNPARLVKMINLCLMQKKSPLRLVEVDTGDQTANFILIEPAKVKPLLDKYNIPCTAISWEYDFFRNAH